MVEGAGFENQWGRNPLVSSNLTPSVTIFPKDLNGLWEKASLVGGEDSKGGGTHAAHVRAEPGEKVLIPSLSRD